MIGRDDGHYSERYLPLYLLCRARSKQLRCRVGRHILKSKYFDDIYCEVENQEKCLLYLFDTKQHRQKDKRISCSELMDCEFDLRKYFKAYLQLRKRIDKQQIQELAVLCRTDFTCKDVELDSISEKKSSNLFEPLDFDIKRYEIEPSATIEKELVKSSHPLYNLAETIANLMFQKSIISTKTVPKRFYTILLKDVFKDESHFKEDFMKSSENLSCEAKQFHDHLEFVLGMQFRKRNLLDFYQLLQIEQMPFAQLVQVKIVDDKLNQRDVSDATWHVDCSVSHADVQQFLSLLVFYGNVPTKEQFEGVLQRYCDKETQNLMGKICGRSIMVQCVHLDHLMELILGEKSNRPKSFARLVFKADLLMNLETAVLMCDSENVSNKLIVVTGDNLLVSADRIATILEKSSKHFLFLYETDLQHDKDKISILINFIVTCDIDWWVIIVLNNHHNALEYVKDFNYHKITVVPEIDELQNQETKIYTDKLNFDDLSDVTKERISTTAVLLQGRSIQLDALLSDSTLVTLPMAALCEWSQNCYQEIVIGEQIETLELDHFIPRNIQTDKGCSLDPFEMDFEPLAILCGLPGAGKSTLLMQLAVNFSKTYEDHIVLLLDFKDNVDSIDSSFDLKGLIFRLMGIDSDDNIKKFIIQKLIEDHRLILLLDGFDEISSKKEKNAISMINGLKDANFQLVMIATRPHRLKILQQHLSSSTVYNILPFTESDQFQFMQERLSNVSSNASLITGLIKTFKRLFNDENLFNSPLQSEIIASIYEDDLASQSIEHWNVAEVLQRFVDKKFHVFAEKFFDRFNRAHEVVLKSLKSSFESDCSELAFRLDENQIADDDIFNKLEPYGLLRMDNGTVSFIDEIFVKFFAAQFIVHHQVDQDRFNHYMLKHFCKQNINRFDSFLEYHIGKTDSRQKLFGSISSSRTINLKQLRQLQQYKLQSDKIKQWHMFFMECCTLEQQVEYLRRTVAEAQFSTFQVIYESLPASIVKEIHFKVDSIAENPFTVNLGNVSEVHLVQLLRTLHHEHPKEVAKKVIANFNYDEEDFITMAIKRDHRSVIEQLFYIENNLYDENESDVLQKYLAGRWRQYLRLVAEHRRNALLEHLLGLIVNRFHPRVIKQFLMNCSIQCLLLETFKDEHADAQVAERVLNFIEQHLSDHDLHVLLNRDENECMFVEKLKDFRNPTLRDLFQSLWMRYGASSQS